MNNRTRRPVPVSPKRKALTKADKPDYIPERLAKPHARPALNTRQMVAKQHAVEQRNEGAGEKERRKELLIKSETLLSSSPLPFVSKSSFDIKPEVPYGDGYKSKNIKSGSREGVNLKKKNFPSSDATLSKADMGSSDKKVGKVKVSNGRGCSKDVKLDTMSSRRTGGQVKAIKDVLSRSEEAEKNYSKRKMKTTRFYNGGSVPIVDPELDLDKFDDISVVAGRNNGAPYVYRPKEPKYEIEFMVEEIYNYITANTFPILQELMLFHGWTDFVLYDLANRNPSLGEALRVLNGKRAVYLEKKVVDVQDFKINAGYRYLLDREERKQMIIEARNREWGTVINIDGNGEVIDHKTRLANKISEFYGKCGRLNPLYCNKMFILLEGGRGGGKSFSAADIVLYRALTRVGSGILLCGREIQASIKNSSKYLLEMRITQHGLSDLFEITESEIRVKDRPVKIIFMGMREATRQDTVKSLTDAFFFWGEEAQTFSQMTLDKLVPTIIRNDDAQFIFTMNRQFEGDPTYKELVGMRKEETLHIRINYYDNPYCPESIRKEADTMKISDYAKYLHVYEGEPQTMFENSLWSKELIDTMRSPLGYDRSNYIELVVACDPATTNEDYSNEYGIQVMGLTSFGEVHLIMDYSSNYEVHDFAKTVARAYNDYFANYVVVEVNNGGDFIKHSILSIDKSIHIREVRAKEDKITRAKPIVNLAQMGKMRHINGGSDVLERQMTRVTSQGFKGAAGESPDRVDAYVWGAIHLFNLQDLETTEVYIKAEYFPPVGDYNEKDVMPAGIAYGVLTKTCGGILIVDYVNIGDVHYGIIKDYWKVDVYEFPRLVNELIRSKRIEVFNMFADRFGVTLSNELTRFYVNEVRAIYPEHFHGRKIEERVILALPYMQRRRLVLDILENKQYGSSVGNLLIDELTSYNPNVDIDRPLLNCVLNLIYIEWGIDDES